MSRLGRMPGAVVGGFVLAGVVLALALYTDALGGAQTEQIFIVFATNLVMVVGVQTFMGTSGIVTFGHLSFAVLGAFITGLLTVPVEVKKTAIPDAPQFIIDASLSFPAAAAVGVMLVCVVAVVIGWPLMRLHGTEASIATFALLTIVTVVLVNMGDITRGAQTFYGVPRSTTVWSSAIIAMLVLVVARLVRDSRAGLSLRATQGSSLAAESSGVNTVRVRLILWTVSAGIMALGGALYAHYVTAFSPSNFSLPLTFLILTMVILGGQTISGAMAGALVITAITELLRRTVADIDVGNLHVEGALLTPIVLGVVTIIILIVRPLGMVGRWEVDTLAGSLSRRRRAARAADSEAASPLAGHHAESRPDPPVREREP